MQGPEITERTRATVEEPTSETPGDALEGIAERFGMPAAELRRRTGRFCASAYMGLFLHRVPPPHVVAAQLKGLRLEAHTKAVLAGTYSEDERDLLARDMEALDRLAERGARVAPKYFMPAKKGRPRTPGYLMQTLHELAAFWFEHKGTWPGCSRREGERWLANEGGRFVLEASAVVLGEGAVSVNDLRQAQKAKGWPGKPDKKARI